MSERKGHEPSSHDEVLPQQTSDDTDLGWSEPYDDGAESAEDERLRREKPPHW